MEWRKKNVTIPIESRKQTVLRTRIQMTGHRSRIHSNMLGNNGRSSTALSNQVQVLGPCAVWTTLHGKPSAHPRTAARGRESGDRDITAGPMSRRLFEFLWNDSETSAG